MNIYKTELFPYLEGDSIVGNEYVMTISGFSSEMMPDHKGVDELKYTLQFDETNKSLILNKTNAKMIAKLFGAETNDWKGKKITIYTEPVKAFGKMYDAIRIKAAVTNGQPEPQTEPEETPEQLGF